MSASFLDYPAPSPMFNGQAVSFGERRDEREMYDRDQILSQKFETSPQGRFAPYRSHGDLVSRIVNHFKREQLYGYAPVFSPRSAMVFCGVGSAFFLGFGIALMISSNSYIECKVNYEEIDVLGGGTRYETIPIESQKCVGVTGLSELPGPQVYVYYEMEGFYQNDSQIVWSKSDRQLAGEIITDASDLQECGNKATADVSGVEKILHPCGILAWNLFGDKFQFYETPPDTLRDMKAIPMRQDAPSLVWKTDLLSRYKNPSNEDRRKHRDQVYFWMSVADTGDGDPTDTTAEETIALHLRDALVYSEAGEMVENSHFIEWMRTTAFPSDRKFYGILEGPLKLPVYAYIAVNFDVKRWGGKKALVLVQPSPLGGKTLFLGVCYLVLACLLCLFCVGVFLKHRRDQREHQGQGDVRWQFPNSGKKKAA